MSKRKSKGIPHYFNNPKKEMKSVEKKAPFMTREQSINQIAANLFLAVWQEGQQSFDDILDRIESDKHVPAQFKYEVYQLVIKSINGFVQQFSGRNILTEKEVMEWIEKKQ